MRILIEVIRVFGRFDTGDAVMASVAIAIGLLLVLIAIGILIFARTRKPLYLFLLPTLFPIVVPILGTSWKFYVFWNMMRGFHEEITGDMLFGFAEYFCAMLFIGLLASAPSLLLSMIGLFVKGRKSKPTVTTRPSQQFTAMPVFVS
jgi:hypothetical protein